jgi:hypothetical protein
MMDFTPFWEPWQNALAEKHGLTCPPGWYGFACSQGWEKLLDKAFGELKALGWSGEIYQVKEKFGTLRMYVDKNGKEEFREIIQRAEEESGRTCEVCGSPGTTGGKGWILTLCGDCRSKREEERTKE